MLKEYLKEETSKTYTENGAVTYASTGSEVLDLFASIGAVRNQPEREFINRFENAFREDADRTVRILFYARDIREGLGERRIFRILYRYMADRHPESVQKNFDFVSEMGRYDDFLCLIGTKMEDAMTQYLKEKFEKDLSAMKNGEEISLLAKWLPSINASSPQTRANARVIARAFGMSFPVYRRNLSMLRKRLKLTENYLREKDYTFDYAKQPSRAMYKYREAFCRHDKERYVKYLEDVLNGNAKVHTGNVMPYEIIGEIVKYTEMPFLGERKPLSEEKRKALCATWENLPDYGREGNVLAVVDTSGSMYCGGRIIPEIAAFSLGVYFAEHNKGAYENTFMEFSRRPQLLEIKGRDIVDKITYLSQFNQIANTDLNAVFEVILTSALEHDMPQEEMPESIVILSDMEFDRCIDNAEMSNFKYLKEKYEKNGYRLPEVVFWNMDSRNGHSPVRKNEEGVILVSGCTPKIFEWVAGENVSPMEFMYTTLDKERYRKITA